MKNLLLLINVIKRSLLLIGVIFFCEKASSQCVNADFSMNDFTNWVGSTGENSSGVYSNVVAGLHLGTPNSLPIDTGQQTILNIPATDPNTGNLLNVLPPGGTTSCRLGNELVNYGAERLKYVVNVDSGNCLFTYQYAVVLEDPAHPLSDQPKFNIYVMDSSGVVVDTVWGMYQVSSQTGLPGWHDATHLADGELDHWKDWTAVAVDLSAHIGENITIQFTTYDCAQGAHYGYAYLSCYCGAHSFRQVCNGKLDKISMPQGFISYLWNSGETTKSIIRSIKNAGDSLICRGITESRDTMVFRGVVTCQITGIDEIPSADNIVSIYPNPTKDNLTIEVLQNSTIEIQNIQGQIIRTINNADKETTIDLRDLPCGIYIIKVRTEKGIEIRKFVKE